MAQRTPALALLNKVAMERGTSKGEAYRELRQKK